MEDKITRDAGLKYWEVKIISTSKVTVVVYTGNRYIRTQLEDPTAGYIVHLHRDTLAVWKDKKHLIVKKVTPKYLKLQGLPLYEVSF